jgi:glycosyltransferase involved in cell wall biosynthesis
VTACSKDLRDTALKLGAPADTELIAWGADPSKFSPYRRTTPSNKIFKSNEPFQITTLGRLVEKKGITFLISAMKSIFAEYPNVNLIIGGDGPLLNTLRSQAVELNFQEKIQFSGSINWNEVPEFLANSDIFILPSIPDRRGNVDGLPTVLLEAMSSGVAVIATDIGGVNMVVSNQDNGIIIPHGDVQAIENSILKLISDDALRKNLGTAARETILKKYNWQSVVERISTILIKTERAG